MKNDDHSRRFILWLMAIAVVFAVTFNETKRSNMNQRRHYASLVIQSEIKESPTRYLKGIDFKRPVKLWDLKEGDVVIQYQTPSAPQGNFYGFLGSKPTDLGISEFGIDPNTGLKVKKRLRVYVVTRDMDVLSSYAAPVKDDWSTPEDETQTRGNKLQLFSSCKECFERRQ